jgi:hypothetical protein
VITLLPRFSPDTAEPAELMEDKLGGPTRTPRHPSSRSPRMARLTVCQRLTHLKTRVFPVENERDALRHVVTSPIASAWRKIALGF